MSGFSRRSGRNRYQIVIEGLLDESWADWLEGLEIQQSTSQEGQAITTMTGEISDQAALRGILTLVWDLNLTLLSVNLLPPLAAVEADLRSLTELGDCDMHLQIVPGSGEKAMQWEYILPLSDEQARLLVVGGKGASLARLSASGLPVPDGFHITTAAYRRFVGQNDLGPRIQAALKGADPAHPATLETASQAIRQMFMEAEIPADIRQEILEAYQTLPGEHPVVAVRSSATAEDLPDFSFAGQQETYLNIHGGDSVLEAVKRCWASLWTGRAIGYRARQPIQPQELSLAVVVQALVAAEAAGILFTADPVSGQRDLALISAAWGLGEAVVGGLVTPDTIQVDKASGRVVQRETADKQLMTVLLEMGTREQPVPEDMRLAPALSDAQAAELVRLGVQIENLYGQPMDIEWTLDEGQFAIVQARPITALPEPGAIPASQWQMPDPKGQYLRTSIVDLLPDPLSPLFASMGMAAIERGIDSMAQDLIHMPGGVLADFIQTINGYAYQKVSFTRRQWWFLLTRMFPALPRLLRQGVPYWQNVALPHYTEKASHWSDKSFSDLSAGEILTGIDELLKAFAFHLGALMASTMGPSAGSEALFTNLYEKRITRSGDPSAPTFLMGYDSLPIQSEKALYDLALWCREREALAGYIAQTTAGQLASHWEQAETPPEAPIGDWQAWHARFSDYLKRYGYSIYDLDFAKPIPMEEPEAILEALKLFIAGQARSPYERQQEFARRREQAVEETRARIKGLKRWAFEKALKWAQSQAPLREDGIAEIGLGYPALRGMLRELGRRLAAVGAIQQMDDIFWLEEDELRAAVEGLERKERITGYTQVIEQRKALWRAQKQVTPPPQLPVGKKYMGLDVESFLSGGEGRMEGNTIKGVAASPGQVRGTARVLHGPEDFGQMQPGDVLVAAITTPAWTPLFAMASAVVTDVGGPLSHGSIVAREYGIPAVMGTGSATRRIQSGQVVTVDGSAGTVTL